MEHDSEVKSYIYQQLSEFTPYVTPQTVVLVVSRNPKEENPNLDDDDFEKLQERTHRIAIILEEEGAQIEAEAYHDDIFEAIKLAKVNLLSKLSEIQDELEADESKSSPAQYQNRSLLH